MWWWGGSSPKRVHTHKTHQINAQDIVQEVCHLGQLCANRLYRSGRAMGQCHHSWCFMAPLVLTLNSNCIRRGTWLRMMPSKQDMATCCKRDRGAGVREVSCNCVAQMCVSLATPLHTYQWVPQFVARVAQCSRVGLPDGTSLDLFSVLKVDGARLGERGAWQAALAVEQALAQRNDLLHLTKELNTGHEGASRVVLIQ